MYSNTLHFAHISADRRQTPKTGIHGNKIFQIILCVSSPGLFDQRSAAEGFTSAREIEIKSVINFFSRKLFRRSNFQDVLPIS